MSTSDDITRTSDAIRALCHWAATVPAELPPPVLRRAALVIVDDIAAILAARDEPEVMALHAQQRKRSARAESTLFDGRGTKVDRIAAAVGNAAAGDWCELDEGYRPALCHAGVYVLPALMAEAEATGLSTGEVLRCLVIGYEVATRFAHGFTAPFGLYISHATLCAIGAAAGIAAARRYDADQFHRAIVTAATMVAPGPFNHVSLGALVRNVWPAQGAWSGISACDWAECGITGLPESPYHVFVDCLRYTAEPEAFTRGLGQSWGIEAGYHKMHACCQYVHSTVDASRALIERLPNGRNAEDVARITVSTHPRALVLTNAEPATTLAAKFSVPHAAAAMAARGSAEAPSFFADTLHDPAMTRLRRLVEIEPFGADLPAPNDRPSRVTWTFADGFSLTQECLSARGGPDQPYSTAEVLFKIERITRSVHPAYGALAADLVEDPASFRAEPWADLVARLTAL